MAVTDERSRLLYPAGFLAVEAATAVVILVALRPGPLQRAMQRPGMLWLGRRSYGIYLWHWPLAVLARPGLDAPWYPLVAPLVIVGGALLLGDLSYRLVERPTLYGLSPGAPKPPPTFVRPLVAGLLAPAMLAMVFRLPTTDPIADSLRAGQVVVDQGTAAAETEWSHATSANLMSIRAAAMKPAPAAVAQGGPPPGTIPVTAIGDSVMLGAAGALQGRLGATGHIDALVSRQFSAGIAVAHELRAEQRLGRVVIVHLGTNGPIHDDRDVDAMMAELGQADAVLFVSIRVDRPWQAVVNQTLASAAHRYPRAHLVDWYGYSAGPPRSGFTATGLTSTATVPAPMPP